jgi:hypothetical protein
MMDEATHEMMTKPQCGLKDRHYFNEEYSWRKRFTIFGEFSLLCVGGTANIADRVSLTQCMTC